MFSTRMLLTRLQSLNPNFGYFSALIHLVDTPMMMLIAITAYKDELLSVICLVV